MTFFVLQNDCLSYPEINVLVIAADHVKDERVNELLILVTHFLTMHW
jgi:hypothetical protein